MQKQKHDSSSSMIVNNSTPRPASLSKKIHAMKFMQRQQTPTSTPTSTTRQVRDLAFIPHNDTIKNRVFSNNTVPVKRLKVHVDWFAPSKPNHLMIKKRSFGTARDHSNYLTRPKEEKNCNITKDSSSSSIPSYEKMMSDLDSLLRSKSK